MKLKGRSILILCLIVLGSYTAYDIWKDEQKEQKKLTETKLMTLNFEQIHRLTIQRSQDKVLLERDETGWKLKEPLEDVADNNDVEDFIKSMVTERIFDVAKEGDIDWALYGLKSPIGTLTLETNTGATQSFTVADKVNFEDKAFLRRDQEERVLLVNSLWQNRVRKTAIDFRQRRLLRANLAAVDELRIKNKSGEIWIQRIDGQWVNTKNRTVGLDQNKVREFLSDFAEARADEIQDKSSAKGKDLKDLFSADLRLDDKKWSAKILQDKSFKIYALVSEPNFFMRMEPGALDRFINAKVSELEPDKAETPEQQDSQEEMLDDHEH